jgi:YbgC/YbaW family acyl-CoA thioester hydrolase
MTNDPPVVLQQADYTVRMADVDAASVIYYASPLRWQEMLVSEWFIRSGHRLSDQIAQRTGCPVVEVRVTYLRPLRLDDPLTLQLTVEHIGRTSFGLSTLGRTPEGDLAVQVHTVNVWTATTATGEVGPMPLPAWLQAELTGQAAPQR